MKLRILSLFILSLIFCSYTEGQQASNHKKHQFITINGGFLVVAISGGISYEFGVKNSKWAIKAGINYYGHVVGSGGEGTSFHLGAMYRMKHFDLSLGIASIDKDEFPTGFFPAISISYRKYFSKDNMLFRVGVGILEFVHAGIGLRLF